MKVVLFTGLVLVVLVGCAQRPESIQAARFASDTFTGLSCKSLKTRMFEVDSRLAPLVSAQSRAASADAAWMAGGAILFFPAMAVAATGPDHSDEIADLKGQRQALEVAMLKNGC